MQLADRSTATVQTDDPVEFGWIFMLLFWIGANPATLNIIGRPIKLVSMVTH